MNQELLVESIKSIIEKLDLVIEKLDKIQPEKKSWFKKKTLEDLLKEMGINGTITKIENSLDDNYEVENDKFIYYVKFEKGLFRNRLYVLIKKQKL